MKLAILVLFISLTSCVKKGDKADVAASYKNARTQAPGTCALFCEATDGELCANLIKEESSCSKSKSTANCKGFVSTLKTAIETKLSCSNSCEKKPYTTTMANRCDMIDSVPKPRIAERSASLLAELKSKEAKSLAASEDFRLFKSSK